MMDQDDYTITGPLEWVHCHIALVPQSLRQIVRAIPEPLAAIVLKLLAEQVEQRYQSASGLQFDLERCRDQWESLGRIDPFPLGEVEVGPLVPTVTFAVRADQLDLLSALKASQAISREIQLPSLQQTLMRLVLEHAGAQRGVLLLADGETLAIHAQAEIVGEETRVCLTPALPLSSPALPVSLLSYVRRTGEAVLLANATESRYAADPYIKRQRPRSVLGLPIVRQSHLLGILYLENNLIAGAFTPNTLTVLELLAAQAAISLDHARLYTNLQQENAERKRVEKELEAQLLQAQKLESLGTLVGGIAHDFNNMLTSILGFTELLLLEVAEKPIHDDLRHIELLSHRAADMVRQLLTFSRHSRGQKHSLALRPFLEEVIRLLKRTIPETIAVELRLAAESLVVQTDATQLQQVVMNLAVNARDAMPNGGRLIIESARVMLDAAFCQAHPHLSPGWYAQLSVSDTGVGIPPTIRSQIFDPFFTTKGVGQGTGLGLSVVYRIVQNHAGAIEVESEMGRGTSMTIYLPLSQQPPAEAETPLDQLLRGNETLLLVEDEPLVLEYGRKALERLGYRVLTAHDGLAALEVFEAHQEEIALVILDVVMPRMGARAAVRELKRRKATVAVLLTTGYDCAEAAGEEWEAVEEYEFLRKPYRIRELAQAVRGMLEHG